MEYFNSGFSTNDTDIGDNFTAFCHCQKYHKKKERKIFIYLYFLQISQDKNALVTPKPFLRKKWYASSFSVLRPLFCSKILVEGK